jgi:hypothetical protein
MGPDSVVGQGSEHRVQDDQCEAGDGRHNSLVSRTPQNDDADCSKPIETDASATQAQLF